MTFDACHIAQTIIKKGDPRWLDCAGLKALVSAMRFEPGEFARFIYRQAADRQENSGWRIFTGHETDDYANNPANIQIVEIGYTLDRDPSLLQPLKEGMGAVFERRTKADPWRRVSDWNPLE